MIQWEESNNTSSCEYSTMVIMRVKLRTCLADIASQRNYRSSLNVKELLKR